MVQMVKSLPAMWETRVGSLSQEDPLEKEMVTHPHVLAWIIPCPEDAGGLQSMGSQESDITEYVRTYSPLCGTDGDQRSKM